MVDSGRPVGQTASVGFQVGVRRTLPISRAQAWETLTSSDGLKLWLGDVSSLTLAAGQRYTTREGTSGELRIVGPCEQLRLTWQRKAWQRPSTLQIRFLPSTPSKTTTSFHQEHLADAHVREEMKLHWEQVLATLTSGMK